MVVSTMSDNNNLHPIAPSRATLSMPNERNTNSASGTSKKPKTYRTVFGASATMATDTAFNHNPTANYKHTKKPSPGVAIEAVKKSALVRSMATMTHNPSPGGGLKSGTKRIPVPSFHSKNNLWSDPNNSFLAGQTNIASGQVGTGRWGIVKQGVV